MHLPQMRHVPDCSLTLIFSTLRTTINYNSVNPNEICQLQSFEAELSVPEIMAEEGGPPSFRGVFIRAPGILEVGPDVQVLAEVPLPSDSPTKNDVASENFEVNPLSISLFHICCQQPLQC